MNKKQANKAIPGSTATGVRLGIPTLLAYGAPAVPLSMLLLPIYIYLPPFYASEMGLSLSLVGGIFLLARLWDGAIDPAIGMLSDRIKTRWGRRKPWIILGTPLLMVCTYFFALPPQGVGGGYLFFWVMAFYVAWTVIFIPYYSWGAELSPDYQERNKVTGFREVGTMLGILAASGLPIVLLPEDPPLRDIITVFVVSVLILLPLSISAACTMVKKDAHVHSDERIDWRKIIHVLRTNKPFMRFLIGAACILLQAAVFDATIIFLITQWMELPGKYLQLTFLMFSVAIVVSPLTVKAGRWIGKHRSLALVPAGFLVSFLIMAALTRGSYAMAMLAFVVYGIFESPLRIFPTSILADIVDYDTLKSGEKQAGLYVAIYNLMYKICMALGVGIALPLLDLTGFNAQGSNAPEQIYWLVAVACGLPVLVGTPALFVLWNFPIDARRHSIIRRRLEQRDRASD